MCKQSPLIQYLELIYLHRVLQKNIVKCSRNVERQGRREGGREGEGGRDLLGSNHEHKNIVIIHRNVSVHYELTVFCCSTPQTTIIMDRADYKRGCLLVRACTLKRSNVVYVS